MNKLRKEALKKNIVAFQILREAVYNNLPATIFAELSTGVNHHKRQPKKFTLLIIMVHVKLLQAEKKFERRAFLTMLCAVCAYRSANCPVILRIFSGE